MPISEARHRANEKYNAKAYDEIKVRVAKGEKEAIAVAAKQCGESVNAYIYNAVRERMQREVAPAPSIQGACVSSGGTFRDSAPAVSTDTVDVGQSPTPPKSPVPDDADQMLALAHKIAALPEDERDKAILEAAGYQMKKASALRKLVKEIRGEKKTESAVEVMRRLSAMSDD